MTKADTPASVPFRRFLPFSPWRASARLRLKSQKSLVNSSLAGALQFCRSRNIPRQGKPRREYCRIAKGLDAVWGHFCPTKPCLPLLIDGINRGQSCRKRRDWPFILKFFGEKRKMPGKHQTGSACYSSSTSTNWKISSMEAPSTVEIS